MDKPWPQASELTTHQTPGTYSAVSSSITNIPVCRCKIFPAYNYIHARSHLEAFWLQPVVAITASVQPGSGQIVYARSDFPHPFQLHGRHGSYGAELTQIQSGRPGQGLAKCICLEASRCAGIIWPGFSQDATGPLPVSHLVLFFRRRPR